MSAVYLFMALIIVICISGLPLRTPTVVKLHDNSKFKLSIDYCRFTVYHPDDDTTVAITENAFCYCFDTQQDGIKIISTSRSPSAVIYNPNSINISSTDHHVLCDIPGPTIILNNGTSFDIELANNMIGEPYVSHKYDEEMRAWPDVTNLHTHGLHVSPDWDNVFVVIDPQSDHTFHYEVQPDHYPGTHWYHAHFHQSVNLQLNSGLFGAMLMNAPGINDHHDPAYEMTDVVLVMHYVYSYSTDDCDCSLSPGVLTERFTYITGAVSWDICSLCFDWCITPEAQREQSGYEYYAESIFADQNGKFAAGLVNGQLTPTISLVVNQWFRFRMVNGNGQLYTQFRLPSSSEACSVFLMAMDGILFKDGWRDLSIAPYYGQVIIDPGARADIAIKCDVPTIAPYAVLFSKLDGTYDRLPRYPEDMTAFYIEVDSSQDQASGVQKEEPRLQAETESKPYTIPDYPSYLYDSYTACPGLTSDCLYPVTDECPCWTNSATDLSCHWLLRRNSVNGVIFNASKPILYVCNDMIYEFMVDTKHPLHSHSLPFQVMQDLPTDGNYFLAKGGDFRDLISSVNGGYKIRFQTTDWLGPMFVHCHFIPHEDEGMIAYFQVIDCSESFEMKDLNPFGYNPMKNDDIMEDICYIFENVF